MFPFLFNFLSKFVASFFPHRTFSNRRPPSSIRNVDAQIVSLEETSSSVDQGEQETLSPLQQVQQEVCQNRTFSLAEAIAREGGSFLKGESTIPRPLRANNAIKQFINSQVADPASAFSTTLFSWASNDIRVSRQLDTPLVALTQILNSLLNEPTVFYEFARQVAIAHANLTGDRPHFQQPGKPPHPDADYTHTSIRAQLIEIVQALKKEQIT